MNKYEYGCTVAAALAYLLLKQQDAVSLVAFDEGIRKVVPPRSKQNHLLALLAALDAESPQKKTDMYDVLKYVAEEKNQKGMVILISDLFAARRASVQRFETAPASRARCDDDAHSGR